MIRILIATAAAMLATPASASIEPTVFVDGVPTTRVSYADLNLHSRAGRTHMAHRIRLAAERVCVGSYYEASMIVPLQNDCYVAAVSSGIAQVEEIASR
jgi:UrcA family protein